MGRVITIANRKGGVGKTTLAIALAETFVFEHKQSTVILDLDPQSSASEILLSADDYADRMLRDDVLPGFFRAALTSAPRSPDRFIVHARHSLTGRGKVDLAIAPNSPEMWDIEFAALRTGQEEQYRAAVRRLIDTLQQEFGLVIVDSPPGKTMAAEEAILASGVVICPIVPERLSVWGMDRMKAYFEELEQTHEVPPWRFVMSRMVGNRVEADAQIETIRNSYQDHFITERHGVFGFGQTELLGLKQAESVVHRIAKFRENPDNIRTLEQFYGAENTQQLRKIARQLQEVTARHA